jgi:hypothetical protein
MPVDSHERRDATAGAMCWRAQKGRLEDPVILPLSRLPRHGGRRDGGATATKPRRRAEFRAFRPRVPVGTKQYCYLRDRDAGVGLCVAPAQTPRLDHAAALSRIGKIAIRRRQGR